MKGGARWLKVPGFTGTEMSQNSLPVQYNPDVSLSLNSLEGGFRA